ncbi:MAG: glycosyltransferase family 1 protein [Polyangiaceae bacterium]|nr:glycosyltransferase family 1 protein [Polyangiaceae bacterium]
MRYVATSFGSAGDFLPTLAIAHALHTAGHEVVFVTNPFHERAVRAAGVEYVPAGELVDLYKLIVEQPHILRTTDGLKILADELAPTFFAPTYWVGKEVIREVRPAAVIGSNLSYGILWAATERRVPSVMVAATPIFWLTGQAPAQFLDFRVPDRFLPHVAGAVRTIGFALADHWLRSIARSLGATSFDASVTGAERSVALHLGMWPELLRPASPSDQPNMRACGFARAGHFGSTAPALSPELEAFLTAGPAPVVIGLGSIYSLGSDDLIADLADACAEIGQRCVIVGPPPRNRDIPEGTLVVPYATYHLLFPRAKALVIHGGAGTTGEALRSGVPSVVVPLGFDQFGLAWQVERLGVGMRVPKQGRTRAKLVEALRTACEDEAMQARAAEVAAELRPTRDGADVAASLILGMSEQ